MNRDEAEKKLKDGYDAAENVTEAAISKVVARRWAFAVVLIMVGFILFEIIKHA